MAEIIPAIIPNSFDDFVAQAKQASAFGASWVQLDVCDGDFVPYVSWPHRGTEQWAELEALAAGKRQLPEGLSYEAHLMVAEPHYLGDLLVRGGVTRIMAHTEAMPDKTKAREAFGEWRRSGAGEIGISLMLDTPLADIDTYLSHGDVDFVQVMAIAEIGEQGHSFDERAISRISELRATYPSLVISVDGGVAGDNAVALLAAGASRLAVGSAIWKAEDPQAAFKALTAIGAE